MNNRISNIGRRRPTARPGAVPVSTLLALLALLAPGPLAAQASDPGAAGHGGRREPLAISARVLDVAAGGSEVTINRGSADRLIPGSECVIRPNRGDGHAQIEWDLYFARGTVERIEPESAVVRLTDEKRPVQPGDYCEVLADLDRSIMDTDPGRIAAFDVRFTAYQDGSVFFELEDLIVRRGTSGASAGAPAAGAGNAIVDALVREIHRTHEVAERGSEGRIIQGGLFDGMSWGEAFRVTGTEHVEAFLEFVAWYPGKYIGYDWMFIDSYASWMISGTESGRIEKLEARARPHAARGDELVRAERFQEAIDAYREALAILPSYGYAEGRLELVRKVIQHRKIVEQDERDVTTRYTLGREYYDLGLYENALLELQAALELGYDSEAAEKWIGYTLAALHRHTEARRILERLHQADPDDENILKWLRYETAREQQALEGSTAESYVTTGDIKYEEGSWDAAITEYKKALELEPDSLRIWTLIMNTTRRRQAHQHQLWARENWTAGEFDAAREQWRAALGICEEIEDGAGVKDILDEMADRMYDSAFYDEAIETYRRILAVDPEEYDPYISIANCYESKDEYEEAVVWAKRGIGVDPEQAWGYNILGYVYLQMGRLEEAVSRLEEAVRADPEYKYPEQNLGTAYILQAKYLEARRHFLRALEIDRDYWDARHNLVAIEVILETRETLRETPGDAEAGLRVARALYALDDYRRAMVELSRVLESRPKSAIALAYLGYCTANLGLYREARGYLERAYRIEARPATQSWLHYVDGLSRLAEDPRDPEGYLLLARDDLFWEHYDEALSDYEYAQKLGADADLVFRGMEQVRTAKEAKRLYDLAETYYNRGGYERALESAERALALYREAGVIRGEVWALLRTGWSLASQFRHREALERYEEAGRRAESMGDESLLAHTLSAIGDYHNSLGEYDDALEYKERARVLYRRTNALLDEARMALSPIGAIRGSLGETDAMIAAYRRALSIHERTMNYKGEAEVLIDLGTAYENEGDFSEALEHKRRALATARANGERWTEMWAVHGLGSIYLELGDAENALRAYRDYLELATAVGSRSDRCVALNGIGLVHVELDKDYDAALPRFRASLDLARLIGYTLMQGVATANIGVTLSRQGRYEEALPYHRAGLELVREVNHRYTEMQGLNELGETYHGMGRYRDALEAHGGAIGIAEDIGVPAERWMYELDAGKAHEALGEDERAIDYYRRAVATVAGIKAKIRSEALRKGFSEQERQIDVYKRLIELLLRTGRPEEALRYIEESKSKIIRDAFGDVKPETDDEELQETLETVDRIEKKKEALQKQLQEERKKPEAERDRKKLENLTRTLATTEGEFNQWMLKLKFQNRAMYDALTIKPTTLGDIQQDIPEAGVILEYFVADDKVYVFCIGRELFFAKSVDIPEEELVRLVREFVRIVQNPRSPRARLLDERGVRLYDLLVRPVQDVVDRFDNVVIVPFGILYYLPFHALVVQSGDASGAEREYLIERKRISYTTSATFTDLLKDERRPMDRLMAFGNPDGSLPGASEEVRIIRDEIYGDRARVWTLEEATKGAFFAHAKDYEIVHLATHGLIQTNPLESYLLFAGASAEERRLTLLEVAGYTALRRKTALVFLSACRTAMESSGGSGSELISLAEAFAMAGPPTLIATLWEVDDASTSLLVERFYRALFRGGTDKLEALRQAQTSLLRSERYCHPFYWAPFVMIGNWR